MSAAPIEDHEDGDDGSAAPPAPGGRGRAADAAGDPTAGMVLHRVLALSARTFLLNDVGDHVDTGTVGAGSVDTVTVDSLRRSTGPRPLWAQAGVELLHGTDRRDDPTERTHQTRVAMRRIRSNLRTFRLLCDPGWGTALRAELAWYGNELGRSRDLDLLGAVIDDRGAELLEPDMRVRLSALVELDRTAEADRLSTDEARDRRRLLTEQMQVLWDGPRFKAKATRPALDVLPSMLKRSWHDVRGAGRTARKDPTDAHLHQLRIRLKDLRYGSETLALVEGGRARKTVRTAERLQSKLGDLHDAVFAVGWLEAVAEDHPDLADAARRLAALEREAAADARRGWKRDLKEVERRWRRWQG